MKLAVIQKKAKLKQSYEEEKQQVLKELRALLLTYPPESHPAHRDYVLNAIYFIEQE